MGSGAMAEPSFLEMQPDRIMLDYENMSRRASHHTINPMFTRGSPTPEPRAVFEEV
jgi:hypothetical protein